MIQHEEWREVAQGRRTDATAHCRACAFRLLARKECELDTSRSRHVAGVCSGGEAGW